MIDKALQFIETYLNDELKKSFGTTKDFVVAASLVDPSGSIVAETKNKVVISVINLEHETFAKWQNNLRSETGTTMGKVAPPVFLNLYVLVSSNHDNYLESFKRLSAVISAFQARPYFSSNDAPNMPAPLTKITLEIFNVPITELSHIWSGIGAKYVPSILYKLRMIAVQENQLLKEVPTVTGLGDNVKPS